jgi:formylglycine-generating enzyme required for sulfatase activity/energy-coupling factor transporter ATP-binding protein EcfA2
MGVVDIYKNKEKIDALLDTATHLVPFVGAGFSRPACPEWGTFLDLYYEETKDDYFHPEDREQYEKLHKGTHDSKYEQLADMLIQKTKRGTFQKKIKKHFDADLENTMKKKFGLLHHAFPGLKITTNFDCLIERSNAGVYICRGNQPEELERSFTDFSQNSLLKLHGGTQDINSIVLTRDQYEAMYGDKNVFNPNASLPKFLSRVFTNSSVLFIGCSLERDRTVMVLQTLPNVRPHFAVMERPKDQKKYVETNQRLAEFRIDPIWIDEFNQIEELLELIANKTAQHDKKNPHIPESYINWLEQSCKFMDITRMNETGKAIRVDLPETFVPLYTYEPRKHADTGETLKSSREPGFEEAGKPVDIEDLIARQQCEYLLIKGQPGSGKTTLLKHCAHQIVTGKPRQGLEGYLPLLILLRDLNGLFDEKKKKKETVTFREIVTSYFSTKEKPIDCGVIEHYCKSKKVLFLLDGLDELAQEYRDRVVEIFTNVNNTECGNKLVISGRPHAIEGLAMGMLGDRCVEVLALSQKQIGEFVTKWFKAIYIGSALTGKNDAEGLLGSIKNNEAIKELMINPLMLTAICILYNDGKQLPEQRAELYKKFIDHLLYSKFENPKNVYEFLKTLAYEMQIKGQQGADRVSATAIMRKIYRKQDNENGHEFNQRIEDLFDEIEPKCGLLKLESGQYKFRHLTFQEFLAAVYIVSNNREYDKAIETYWENVNFREVIKLFISHLSIDSGLWATTIIEKNVLDDAPSLNRLLLSVEALIDIHKDNRNPELVKKTQNRLISIFHRKTPPDRVQLAKAGELLGWLEDPRDLRKFIKIEGGKYDLQGLGDDITIPSFEIGAYPVTNKWYGKFIEEDGYKNQNYWTENGKKWLENTNAEYPVWWHDRKWNCPNVPVVGICWWEAMAYCRWLEISSNDKKKYRLPTEQEWQAAAAGREQRQYPWGKDWNVLYCNNWEGEDKIGRTSSVGIFEQGKTPEGGYDFAGNVWEWTRTNHNTGKEQADFVNDIEVMDLENKGKFIEAWEKANKKGLTAGVRGGAWNYVSGYCRCACRLSNHPYYRIFRLGFRCSRI